jgi:benzylsuccinate CoA-transferase BbsF subunit
MTTPLEGLNVVDIGWLMVGPVSARYLAELGADTIKVETGKRLDPLRGLGPFKDGQTGPERTLSYHWINAGKRGLAVDLKSPQGLDLVRRLVAGADIFIESFTPGAIDEMGLSYAELSARNPGLIMVSTGLLGRKGTMGLGMSGTGMTGAAFAGATNLVGWPDRPPTGPYGPWTDAVAPRFVVAAVLAALHRRGQTGRGDYIDLAQAEAGLQFLSPVYFDFAVNRVVAERAGTAGSPLRVPCSAYPCEGVDRWLVIDADTPKAWDALRALLAPALDDPVFSTLVGRLRSRETIDARIAGWTRTRDPGETEALLQRAGIPAHVVCNDHELAFDPDLEACAYQQRIEDPVIGEGWIPGPQYRLTRTPHAPTRAGPRIGDASEEILISKLGLSAADVERLRHEGVLA